MKQQTILKNIKHCDYYINKLSNTQHKKYYIDRKYELMKMIPEDVSFKQIQSPKIISSKSPKLMAEKYFDLIQSGQLKLREVCRYEKINEGSLSKAIFRIREKKGYGINKKIKM